jgi:hypothetical protein
MVRGSDSVKSHQADSMLATPLIGTSRFLCNSMSNEKDRDGWHSFFFSLSVQALSLPRGVAHEPSMSSTQDLGQAREGICCLILSFYYLLTYDQDTQHRYIHTPVSKLKGKITQSNHASLPGNRHPKRLSYV